MSDLILKTVRNSSRLMRCAKNQDIRSEARQTLEWIAQYCFDGIARSRANEELDKYSRFVISLH